MANNQFKMEEAEEKRALGLKDTLLQYNMPELISKRLPKQETLFRELADVHKVQEGYKNIPTPEQIGSREEILNIIFPPHQWEENGQLWKQTVSTDPVTAEGVAELSERLDKCLQEQQAKEDGIDSVRTKLFGQFFDEIIRIETIICGERGILLGRLRGDFKYTVAIYRKLYESCMAYAMRKSLQAEKKDRDEVEYLMQLKEANLKLQVEIDEVKKRMTKFRSEIQEKRDSEMRKHSDTLVYLKEINHQMKDQLRSILKPKKQQ